jgi:fatty-acyl-CoA synthase
MSANDAPPNFIDPNQGCVPRELTQARLDRRAAASALIKPADLYTLADRVEEMARRQGERPFLLYGDQRFSYAEVDARANQVAHAAFARGLRPGDVCALAIENRPAFFFTWFGLVKLGVVVAFINTQVSGRPLAHALETTQARAVVVGRSAWPTSRPPKGCPTCPCGAWPMPRSPARPGGRQPADTAFDAEVAAAPREAFRAATAPPSPPRRRPC